MTVRELEDRISHTELIEWIAYSRIEPFGSEVKDYRAGVIAATIANVNRGKKQKAFKPTDFMPSSKPSKPLRATTGVDVKRFLESADP